MKINKLEAHDRLLQFKKQADLISQGCLECIKNKPPEFGSHPFYIFAHKRSLGMDERMSLWNQEMQVLLNNPNYKVRFVAFEDVPTDRLLWQSRLTKPIAQENSMLFKYYPATDEHKLIWMLPQRELWDEYTKGKLMQNKTVVESIHNFLNNKTQMEASEPDDLDPKEVEKIHKEIKGNYKFRNAKFEKI